MLSSRYVDSRDKTSRLVNEAVRVGLKINAKKSEVMRVNARNDQRIEVNTEQIDEVEEFVYLGALVDKEGRVMRDIQQRLSKARQAFYRIQTTWSTSVNDRKTVRSVLVYGCEA